MPQMGQSVEEATIVEWLKKEGDRVEQGEPLFTIQTDKAEIECEATASGVLRKILVQPDVEVPVLTPLALVGEPDEPLPDLDQYEAGTASGTTEAAAPGAAHEAPRAAVTAPSEHTDGRPFISPRARAKASELGLDPSVVTGSGPSGRVLETDVVAYAESQGAVRITPTARRLAAAKGLDVSALEGTGVGGKVTKADVLAAAEKAAPARAPAGRKPLTPMRRIIAQRMSESKFSAPHYYMTIEVDMSAAKAFRAQATSFKPSFNDFVLAATVEALGEFPQVNARWAGDAIEEAADINLGVAVALPEGLIVPVLKRAQHMSFEEMSAAAKDLAEKAKTGKLLPDDYIGNTFTVSNLGPYGVDDFTAIINQPDSAILAIGQMKDRPVAVDGGIDVRPIMKITMSSDHRVVDGAVAAQFLGRLKAILEAACF